MSSERTNFDVTRRQVLKGTAVGVGGFILSSTTATWVYAKNATKLDPLTQLDQQFVNDLPVPPVIDARGGGTFEVNIQQTNQDLGLANPGGGPRRTVVQGYGLKGSRVTYLGPTFVAMKDEPIDVRWVNKIPGRTLVPVDTTVHRGDPVGPADRVSVVTHLHGGRNESPSDGLPEAWFTQNFSQTGPQFAKETYHYDNAQEAGTLWYHDHSLGITRINVYAGLAGFYLLRDENEIGLISNEILPSGDFEVGLAIQDRCFEENGHLFLPASPDDAEFEDEAEVFDPANVTGLNPDEPTTPITLEFERPKPDPTVVAEFFGDFILVNGKIWPKLEVTPDLYRFRVLNGSDSRFYVLKLQDKPQSDKDPPTVTFDFFVIGSDAGFLANPVQVNELLIAPGERYDIVIDFASISGGTTDLDVFLNNFGPDDPFKGFTGGGGVIGGAADPATTGRVIKFEVRGDQVGSAPFWSGTSTILRPDGAFTVDDPVDTTRKLFLFEGLDEFGRLQPLLGTSIDTDGANSRNSRAWFEPITENPGFGDVEIWDVFNTTEDAHPIHLHLVAFQIIGRADLSIETRPVPQPMAVDPDNVFGVGADVTTDVNGIEIVDPGDAGQVVLIAPAHQEQAPKDTAVMLPGQVTRIKAKFDPPNSETSGDGTIRYVWHCHILSHEDHEMMRPYRVEES